MLSDEAKINRNRRNTINIHMTCLSWLLEFIAGIIFLVCAWVYKDLTEAYLYLLFIDNALIFVIIPSSYILNTEVIKDFIVKNGWMKPIRALFPSRTVHQSPTEESDGVVPKPVPMI